MALFRPALVTLACLSAGPAFGHDFWIDLGAGHVAAVGQTVRVQFLVGHAGESERWTLRRERVVSFRDYGPDRLTDLQPALRTHDEAGRFSLGFLSPGSHLVAFETTPAEIELDAGKFNEYLKTEGLTPALERRRATDAEDEPGREIYSRRAKGLVQVGDAPTGNVTAPIGQTLEIVPEKNPLVLSDGEPLPVRILYFGEPLAGASVHLESLSTALVPEATRITGADGRAEFVFPLRGAWKIDVVWTEPIENHPRAEFSTVFSSFVFGY
jgi:uncharacterized GH25 family protein